MDNLSEPLLELREVSASYGELTVLKAVDLAIARGSVTALLGSNGAGKTTALRAISNVEVDVSGSIRFEGKEIAGMPPFRIARLGVAHVPQGRGTFSRMSVEENLALGSITRKNDEALKEDLERVYGYFPRLKERRRQQAGTLSGGEQQMLAISRALVLRPKLLLLDEPSFGLAPLVVEEIFGVIRAIKESARVSVLLVEQNAHLALSIADRAYVLKTGQVALGGNVADVAQDPSVRHAYLS